MSFHCRNVGTHRGTHDVSVAEVLGLVYGTTRAFDARMLPVPDTLVLLVNRGCSGLTQHSVVMMMLLRLNSPKALEPLGK